MRPGIFSNVSAITQTVKVCNLILYDFAKPKWIFFPLGLMDYIHSRFQVSGSSSGDALVYTFKKYTFVYKYEI